MTYKSKKRLVQVYTGNGKGKTTAAIGLAIRAAGAGYKVYIQQFIKGRIYSELKALSKIKNIKAEQCGRGCFIKGKPTMLDKICAQSGLLRAEQIIMSGKYDLVILDEVNVALKLGLIECEKVIDIISRKPKDVEIVLTGRYCPSCILECADLVTEMREIKHPYKKGIPARRGIEY
ncbi:MAG: cob(I)yrinic acid a,c-diamide adenosyltransferase [Omnitrophica bacterium RIFCSPLOWO2_01_FULL_45_10]|nr:MAG: cob(I)yrinic acid a,c-diamide adenosyltransferase [Omnitrophica bacterium RIFCSPLOWO2_01_FULL_45_10]